MDGAKAEHAAGRYLLTEQCSRSIYETVASYYDFGSKLIKLLENPDHQELHDFIIARVFATRVPAFLETHGDAIKAPNVITQLEKLSKNTPSVMEAYERLCDIVHPNGMGASIYFSKIDETDTAQFTDGGNDPDRAYSSFVSGMLLRHGDTFGIMYATRYGNEGFERFSIAHEIAHFLLEGHLDHVLKNGEHYSHAGFTSADPYEIEADHFAAGLLMPETLFKTALRKRDTDFAAVEYMASLCKTSLTATAIRCTELTRDAVAVIISTGPVIDYCFLSEAMKSLPQVRWIKKGTHVPSETETAKFNAEPARILAGDRAASGIDVRDWLGGTRSVRITEEVVGLGRYGKTLTVISSTSIGNDITGYDDEEDDEKLNKSWTPRFRK